MDTDRDLVRPTRSVLPRLGAACLASGVLGAVVAVVSLAYPPDVPDSQWSYPYPVGVFWVVGVVLALIHVLTLAGFVGVQLADPHRHARAAVLGLWVAIAGYALLVVAEMLSAGIGGQQTTSSAAATVGGVFGVASLLTAVGSLIAGVVIARAGVWTGLGRWMVLASGVIMVLLVTPANITGSEVFRMVALTLWSLSFIPLGRAIASAAPR